MRVAVSDGSGWRQLEQKKQEEEEEERLRIPQSDASRRGTPLWRKKLDFLVLLGEGGGVRWDSGSSEVIQKFFNTTEEKHLMTNDDKYDSPPLLTMFGSPGFIAQ